MNLEMLKREEYSKVIILFFSVFFIWILLQFIAPLALPNGSIEDLSGLVGISDNDEKIKEIPAPWGTIYGIGDTLCHQKVERSFLINGNQMPFCARCTAIWLGIAIGLGFMIFYKIELDEKFIIILFVGLVPIGIDGLGQLFNLWESNNIIRVITGLIIGIISGIAVGIIVDEINEILLTKNN
jgi:uncharacterized membrane protein